MPPMAAIKSVGTVRRRDTRPCKSGINNTWTRPAQFPYERTRARVPTLPPPRSEVSRRRIDGMQESSPRGESAAIALHGINLSLGRGAARVHILKDISLNIGRGEAIG